MKAVRKSVRGWAVRAVLAALTTSVAVGASASVQVTAPSNDIKERLQQYAHGMKNPVERYHEYLDKRAVNKTVRSGFAGGVLSPDQEYLQFKTQEEAFAWYNTFAPIFAKVTGTDLVPLVLPTDAQYAPAYARLQTGVHKLWVSYKELFPEQTAGLLEPFIILRRTDEINAFITRDFSSDRIVHAININTGIVDVASITDEELFGVIGHELAHSVFRHALPKYQVRVVKYFDGTKFAGKYSFEAKKDPALTAIVEQWMNHAGLAGEISIAELQDLPSMGIQAPDYLQIMLTVVKGVPACNAMVPDLKALLTLQTFDSLSSSFSVSTKDVPQVSQISTRLRRQLADCTAGKKIPLAKIYAAITGMSEDEVSTKIPQEDKDAFDGAADLGGGIVAATHLHRAALQDIARTTNIDTVGSYTFEEHADDIGTIVLQDAGYDASKFGPFFLQVIDADGQTKCKALEAAHKLPPRGNLMDPHRAGCYRADHISKISNEPEFKTNIKAFAAKFLTATWSQTFLQ